MSYLIKQDYLRIIQPSELDSMVALNYAILSLVEGSVEQEIRSFLMQRYDLDTEFKNTGVYSYTTVYKAGDRVYLDASAYDASKTYAVNVLTLQDGNVYICITAITVPEAFTIGKWTLIGVQYAMFYVTTPYPVFDQDTYYKKGTQIWWANNVYTAKSDSSGVSHEMEIQAIEIEKICRGNIVPNSPNTSVAQAMWGIGVPYSVAAGTLPTNNTKWTAGDNRNQYFVELYLDMAIYHCSKRIAPNNIPVLRVINYMGDANDRVQIQGGGIVFPLYSSLGKLMAMAIGDINAQLPLIQPKQGSPIRYGGKVAREYNGI